MKIRCVAVGCRLTPHNKPTVVRMRDMCGTNSLVHTGASEVRALLNEAYLATLARVMDSSLVHPH